MTRRDLKYSRFDILRICYQHHKNSFYIGLDCQTVGIIYNHLNEYFKMVEEDSSYVYIAMFLLLYTRGTVLNHRCSLGCCDPNQVSSQYIDLGQIKAILPNSIQIDGTYQIAFELLECFDVFKMYLEPFLVNLCRKCMIAGNLMHPNLD
eukprot:624753_1